MRPILFRIPLLDVPVYAYGGMLALSLLVGWTLVMTLGRRQGYKKEVLVGAFTWTTIAALVGARLLYVAANGPALADRGLLAWVDPRGGGLVAYGGFLGGLAGAWVYLRRRAVSVLGWADVVVPALGSGLGLTRLGCWLQGCCFGRTIPDPAPAWLEPLALRFPNWAVQFPNVSDLPPGAPAFAQHLRDGLVTSTDAASLPVYPTQPLESLVGWVGLGLTLLVLRRRRFRGQVLLVFAVYYGVLRAGLEMLRGDLERGGIGPLSTSQIVSAATVGLALAAWPMLARRGNAARP